MLQPLSVQDAIWLEVERERVAKETIEAEQDKINFLVERVDSLELLLMDLRYILVNSNVYIKLDALKEAKRRKIDVITDKELPSTIISEHRRKAKMTEEEKQAEQDKLIKHLKRQEELDKQAREIEERVKQRKLKEKEQQKQEAMDT